MTNPRLKHLLREAVMENRHEKICLIEDLVKAKKFLYSLGYTEHDEFIQDPVGLFDRLYDLDITALKNILNHYSKEITLTVINQLKA